MSRTHKDKNPIYRIAGQPNYPVRTEPDLKRRYLLFKRSGPPSDGDQCTDCGGLTDFQSGFLSCSECGRTDGVVEMFEMEGFAA